MGKTMNILFVCHGNICRSPMAEFVFKDMVRREGASDLFHIESAATTNEEIGNPPHPGTCAVLAREGIEIGQKRACRIREADYQDYDLIIGMDEENMRSLERFFRGDPDHKLYKLLSFAGTDRDVADPWYTGDFDVTFDDIMSGCTGLLFFLKRECGL